MHWPRCSPASRARRVAPAEIVIADDGSGAPTREVIDGIRRALSRAGAPGVAAARGLPRRAPAQSRDRRDARRTTWCSSTATCCCIRSSSPITRAAARRGFYTQGVRVHADAALTAQLIADPATCHPDSGRAGFGGLRRAYLLHSPALAALTRRVANALHRHQGVQPGHLARRPGARQRLQRSDRGLGPGRQGTVRAPRECRRAPADAAVRRHRLPPAPCRRHRAPTLPRESGACSQTRDASAASAASAASTRIRSRA